MKQSKYTSLLVWIFFLTPSPLNTFAFTTNIRPALFGGQSSSCLQAAVDEHVDCAIVGGGPGGLAAAIAIVSQCSSPSTTKLGVYERDAFQPKGASIQISQPGWESLQALDEHLVPKLKATGVPVTAVQIKPWNQITSQTTRSKRWLGVVSSILLKTMSLFRRMVRKPFNYVHLWHNVRTELANHAKDIHAERFPKDAPLLRHHYRLKDIRPLPNNNNDITSPSQPRFELTFQTQSGHTKTVQARYVIACDGINSQVRAALPLEPDVLLAEQKSVWRGVAPHVSTFGKATFYRGSSGQSALVFPGGKGVGSSWTVICDSSTTVVQKSETNAEARRRVLDVIDDCDDEILQRVIQDSPIIIEHKLHVRNFDLPWESAYDGLIYLGDAAHPVRPTGEGTALAFEDANVLGQQIAKHGLSVTAFREYERERYEPVKEISEKVRAQAQAFYRVDKPQSHVAATDKASP